METFHTNLSDRCEFVVAASDRRCMKPAGRVPGTAVLVVIFGVVPKGRWNMWRPRIGSQLFV